MDRVFESGAAGSPPSAPASPSSGYPTAGNPSLAVAATKPGPWWYHMVAEEIMSVILAAGLTPNHTDTNQLLDALRASGVFQTAAQFDNDTSVATTAFVRAGKGGTSGLNSFNASTTLVLADVGKQIFFYGSTATQTITLPDASTVPAGEGYWITNQASVAVTLKGNGSQNLSVNLAGAGQSLSNTTLVNPGDSIFVPSNGASQWNIHGYTSAGQFPLSMSANGYQRLPSGLIIQWGTWTASGTTGNPVAVTFPISFPNGLRALSGMETGASATTQSVWADTPGVAGFNGRATGISVSCYYIAIGN